jgi:hypothetical protein
MKVITTSALTAAILFAGSPAAMAARNFSDMTNGELAALRGSMPKESDETRESFRKEWQKRVTAMTPAERETFAKPAGDSQSKNLNDNDSDCQ